MTTLKKTWKNIRHCKNNHIKQHILVNLTVWQVTSFLLLFADLSFDEYLQSKDQTEEKKVTIIDMHLQIAFPTDSTSLAISNMCVVGSHIA